MSEDFIDIISDDFIDDEIDFIKEFTHQLWRQYDLKYDGNDPISFKSIKKIFEIFFSNLAMFQPRVDKLRPISDKGRF
jgi:hypothetical protein